MFRLFSRFRRETREIHVRGGFAVRLEGAPLELIMPSDPVGAVALCGIDFPDVRPDLQVETGQEVQAGDTLFVDRRRPQICFAAPVSGTVIEIRYGRRRMLEAVVIQPGGHPPRFFDPGSDPADLLLQSGLWTSFLTRPFGRIPDPGTRPERIFVTAMDTRPLAADPVLVIEDQAENFRRGIAVLSELTSGPIHICHAVGRRPPIRETRQIRLYSFRGKHPAGLAGTHVHCIAPARQDHIAWCIGYSDVMAIGHLFLHGALSGQKIISAAGPGIANPGLFRVPPGARIADIVGAELKGEAGAILSGDAIHGRPAAYLGRYHNQITALVKDSQIMLRPLADRLIRLIPGGEGARPLPLEALQRALPRNIPAVPLLRALETGDVRAAMELGCLDLVEEDLALLPFLCNSRQEHGRQLRQVLDRLAAEA